MVCRRSGVPDVPQLGSCRFQIVTDRLYNGMMMSFAPRFTSLRRAASMTMRRKVPVWGIDFACSVRSTVLPERSRPSRREPSHSPAASTASSQLTGYRYASSSRLGGHSRTRATGRKGRFSAGFRRLEAGLKPAFSGAVRGGAVRPPPFSDLCDFAVDRGFRSRSEKQAGREPLPCVFRACLPFSGVLGPAARLLRQVVGSRGSTHRLRPRFCQRFFVPFRSQSLPELHSERRRGYFEMGGG